MRNQLRAVLAVFAAACAVSGSAPASSTPVGPLPHGPTVKIKLAAGQSFTVRLPKSQVAGRVWRVARPYNGRIVRELDEGETSKDVWLRYKAVAHGTTKIVFALTRGETPHAYAARTFQATVTG